MTYDSEEKETQMIDKFKENMFSIQKLEQLLEEAENERSEMKNIVENCKEQSEKIKS